MIFQKHLEKVKLPIKIAIIGSLVEKDEMKNVDIGVAGDGDEGIIFKNGEIIKRVQANKIVETLLEEINERLLEIKHDPSQGKI